MSIFAGVPVSEKFAHDHPGSALTVIISSVRFVNAMMSVLLSRLGHVAPSVAAAAPRVVAGDSERSSDPPHPASEMAPSARAENATAIVRCIVCPFGGPGLGGGAPALSMNPRARKACPRAPRGPSSCIRGSLQSGPSRPLMGRLRKRHRGSGLAPDELVGGGGRTRPAHVPAGTR